MKSPPVMASEVRAGVVPSAVAAVSELISPLKSPRAIEIGPKLRAVRWPLRSPPATLIFPMPISDVMSAARSPAFVLSVPMLRAEIVPSPIDRATSDASRPGV